MSEKSLHPVQQQLLSLLAKNRESPYTVREIQSLLEVSSTSVVTHHIKQLEKKGFITRNPSNPQDYIVHTTNEKKEVFFVNLYGLASCSPTGSLLDGTVIDKIPISSKLLNFPVDKAFLVKAKGKSMTPKIFDGDLVIASKADYAENGSIVVCVNDGECLIKKIKKQDDQYILISLNLEFEPFIASRDFRIEGVVKSVISYSGLE